MLYEMTINISEAYKPNHVWYKLSRQMDNHFLYMESSILNKPHVSISDT